MRLPAIAVPLVASFVLATPAQAALPEAVRAMLENAMRTGDKDSVDAVVRVAKDTLPGESAEIDDMYQRFEERQARLAKREAAQETERVRDAGILELWTGEGEIGAFRATGNTSNLGFAVGLKLERKGIDWEHQLRLRADYQRDRGRTTREQYLAAYRPRYTVDDGFFLFGLAQYERDRFQGYSARYTLSGGVGYKLVDSEDMTLAVEAGPAWRRTEFVGGASDASWSGLASLDFDWQIAEAVKLTQDASAYLEADNTTLISATGLEAGMSDGLKARLSYTVEHDTDPPAGAVSTDTLSRFTLVYGF
ncbi:hypothetical protein GCM10011371_04490 [Novosphingobium marinum]|uniref:Putative salt-induced outer membrane protein n=1 Tax=Novosphingobium marinum TaxID=1514948 RepID=A0A7Y9XT96_9SPHN|nr:DUF481 domain-containing protein [Novosphingobium marinum]NYH94139.1 putative salt-induced outer membrane protein [Novosphingobium marinum]GGC19887.1 hypothetical protein GCM10011371_04490 [Novosphingobium marinum]